MLICPDCASPIIDDRDACSKCSWEGTRVNGIPVYLSTSDHSNDLINKYISNYDEIAEDDLAQSIQDVRYLVAQADKLAGYLGVIKDLNVCEVGIGQGHLFRKLAARSPRRLVGVDISMPYLIRLRDDGNELYLSNAENLPFKDEFDVIVATDILEHVLNVGDFLVSVNRALKPGGKFVVRVPLEENLIQYSKLLGCKYDFVHLRTFSRRNLIIQLEQAGFFINKIHYDGFSLNRLRRLFRNRIVSTLLKILFPDKVLVCSINNYFGKIFMNPIEIVAVSKKHL